jgi:hypothetical protein
MTRLTLIGATAVSLLALAAPATAQDFRIHRYHYGRVIHQELPVQDALRWGYGTGYRTSHSGFGGLYGDGYYPGNVYDNDNIAPYYAPFG